jgi:preprotein translocase subunit SecG
MFTAILIIHLIVCFFLIFIILIQSSKGAEMGATFGGGSSHTLFGSRGAATFLNKVTTVAAVVFMLTSLSLAVLSIKRSSVMPESVQAPESKTMPSKDNTTSPLPVKPD